MRKFQSETGGSQLHAVGKILQKGGAYDSYRLADEEVPWLFANKGRTAGLAVQRYLEAGGSPEALDNAFAFSLRRAAQNDTGGVNPTKFKKWLADHEEALSQRPELLARFRTIDEAQKRLDEINQSLAEHEASYPLKPGWGAAGILPQFWKPGPQGSELMDRYLQMTGARPEAVHAAEDYAALSFADRAIDKQTGQINPRAAAVWLSQHQHALARLPGVAERFANAATAQQKLGEVLAEHAARRKAFEQSVAGAFIGDDPEKAIRRVFTGNDRTQKAELLMRLVQGNKAAEDGIRRAALDHIVSEFEGAPVTGGERGAIRAQNLIDFLDENRGPLKVLFGDAARNFDALRESLRRGRLVQNAKVPGGSDTTEKMLAAAGPSTKGRVASDFLAYIAGHVASHLLGFGGLGGEAGGLLAAGAREAAGRVLRERRAEFEILRANILDRMLLDPAFALDKLEKYPAMLPKAQEHVMQRLTGRAVQSLLLAARGADLPQQDNSRPHRQFGGAAGFASGIGPGSPLSAMAPLPLAMPGGGSPMMAGMYQRFASLPQEKLQELSVMFPPNGFAGQMAQRALQQKHMQPGGSGSGQNPTPLGANLAQPQGAPGIANQPGVGMAAGGTIRPHREAGGIAEEAPWFERREAGELYEGPRGLSGRVPALPSSPAGPIPAALTPGRVIPADIHRGLRYLSLADLAAGAGPYGTAPPRIERIGNGPPRPPPISETELRQITGYARGGGIGERSR